MYSDKMLGNLSDSSVDMNDLRAKLNSQRRRKVQSAKPLNQNAKIFSQQNMDPDTDTSTDDSDIRSKFTIRGTRRRQTKSTSSGTYGNVPVRPARRSAHNKIDLPVLNRPLSFIVFKEDETNNNTIGVQKLNVMNDVSNTNYRYNPNLQSQVKVKTEPDFNSAPLKYISNEMRRRHENILNSNSMTTRLLNIKYGNTEYLSSMKRYLNRLQNENMASPKQFNTNLQNEGEMYSSTQYLRTWKRNGQFRMGNYN